MFAITQYRSGFSSLAGRLATGVMTGDGLDGWFRRSITDMVASRPPTVTRAMNVCSGNMSQQNNHFLH
jgi:hypothetical protein